MASHQSLSIEHLCESSPLPNTTAKAMAKRAQSDRCYICTLVYYLIVNDGSEHFINLQCLMRVGKWEAGMPSRQKVSRMGIPNITAGLPKSREYGNPVPGILYLWCDIIIMRMRKTLRGG